MAGGLPFDPLRGALYTTNELFNEFLLEDPDSYARCTDIEILKYFVKNGKNPARDSRASTLQALHDNSISECAAKLLKQSNRIVAIMGGGHGVDRSKDSYVNGALLAYNLASAGCFLVSGGGPGAMEATHMGAAFARQSSSDLHSAIKELADRPTPPANAKDLVSDEGTVNQSIARALHDWLEPAIKIADNLGNDLGPSLGIPTWLYGYEPTTPFASNIAKYFQNSLREDGLVTAGAAGIVFMEGKAGTIQEIFQDATQNYYGTFCPMVFLSSPADAGQHYWEKTLPVRGLIESLLGKHPGLSFESSLHRLD
jgi:predicted Rossmann-fold nucleotide-binding protein